MMASLYFILLAFIKLTCIVIALYFFVYGSGLYLEMTLLQNDHTQVPGQRCLSVQKCPVQFSIASSPSSN